jgi:hypothetical protein
MAQHTGHSQTAGEYVKTTPSGREERDLETRFDLGCWRRWLQPGLPGAGGNHTLPRRGPSAATL